MRRTGAACSTSPPATACSSTTAPDGALYTANETPPWAIARDPAGTLYVGARDELGVYRPDSLGRLTYCSLVDRLPASHRPVGNVRDVVATPDGLYFGAQTGVLHWESPGSADSMQAVTDTAAVGVFGCRGATYVQRADGLDLLGTAPNPARQRATVRFAVPEGTGAEAVTMRLYDVLGRRVRTVTTTVEPGRHEQRLDLSGLSSGVYVLRLQMGAAAKTRKLTVVR